MSNKGSVDGGRLQLRKAPQCWGDLPTKCALQSEVRHVLKGQHSPVLSSRKELHPPYGRLCQVQR